MCSTSKQGGPKAHNLLHINSPPQTQGGCETNLRLPFVNQSTKASLKMWLGEDICKLIFREDREQLESTIDKMITNKMTIDLDVFSPFMEDIIVSNVNGTLVVTIKRSNRGCRQPKSLRSHRSQRSLDVVSARTRYSTSIQERATRFCFLLRQEIKEKPRRKQ